MKKNNEFDEVLESPYDLVGQNLLYKVKIIKVKNLKLNFCKNLRIEYQSFYDRSINYSQLYNQNDEKNVEFDIGEEFEHKIEYLTKEDVEFLEKENIKFKIYACEDVDKKEKIKIDEKEVNEEEETDDNDVGYKLERKNQIIIKENYFDDEPDEPSEFIKKDDGINIINNYFDNKENNKGRGRSESQKLNNLNKDKDCNIF